MNNINYYVLNEHTLGYIDYSFRNDYLFILHSSTLKGCPWSLNRNYFQLGYFDTIRKATLDDFNNFNVSWKGHLN